VRVAEKFPGLRRREETARFYSVDYDRTARNCWNCRPLAIPSYQYQVAKRLLQNTTPEFKHAKTFYLWLTRARCSGCADEGSPHWRTCAREAHLVRVWSKSIIVRGQLAWLRALNTRFANRPANPRAASSSSTQLILVCIFVCSSSQWRARTCQLNLKPPQRNIHELRHRSYAVNSRSIQNTLSTLDNVQSLKATKANDKP